MGAKATTLLACLAAVGAVVGTAACSDVALTSLQIYVVSGMPGWTSSDPATDISVSQDDLATQLKVVQVNTGPFGMEDRLDKTSEARIYNIGLSAQLALPLVPTGHDANGYFPVSGPGSLLFGHDGTGQFKIETDQNYSNIIFHVAPSTSPQTVFGAGQNGAVAITTDTDWIANGVPGRTFFPQYTTFSVAQGATLTVPTGLNIRVSGAVNIQGKIIVADMPPLGSDFPSINITTTSAQTFFAPGFVGGAPGTDFWNLPFGTGAGTFGLRAGGGITIGAGGLVQAVPRPAQDFNGGPGGGVIVMVWGAGTTFTNAGVPGVNASGGAGGSPHMSAAMAARATVPQGGSGGGGGLIRLIGPGASTVPMVGLRATGGNPGAVVPDESSGLTPSTQTGGQGGHSVGLGGTNHSAGGAGIISTTDVPDPTTVVPARPQG